MPYLLHIESTSTVCSVAISKGNKLLAFKELDNGYTHAENLHVFIQQLISESNIIVSDLKAISVSSGPGSYTGLRIGFSAAKGLAFALKIPLISVSTLQSLTASILIQAQSNTVFCPLLDARRMEVYYGVFDINLNELMPVNALIINEESIKQFSQFQSICFFGDGMPKSKELLSLLPNASFVDNILPSARNLISLAYEKYINGNFEDIAYSEPLYLKDFFFTTAKK